MTLCYRRLRQRSIQLCFFHFNHWGICSSHNLSHSSTTTYSPHLVDRRDDNGCAGASSANTRGTKHLPQHSSSSRPDSINIHPPVLGWHSPTSLTAHPRSVRVSYCNARCLWVNNPGYIPRMIAASHLSARYLREEHWSGLPAVWSDGHSAFPTFTAFIQQLRGVWQPRWREGAGEQLISLRQRGGSAADYALSFAHSQFKQDGQMIL